MNSNDLDEILRLRRELCESTEQRLKLIQIVEMLQNQIHGLEARIKTVHLTNHGNSGYSRGCRCDVCREANRQYMTEYKRRRKERGLA